MVFFMALVSCVDLFTASEKAHRKHTGRSSFLDPDITVRQTREVRNAHGKLSYSLGVTWTQKSLLVCTAAL